MKRALNLLLVGYLLGQSAALAKSPLQPAAADVKAPIMLEVVPFPPYHAAGNDVPTVLRLKRANDEPVTLEDLQVVDAADVDVLVVDESLSDFHYQHLAALDAPGEYRFVLRSKYGGRYFVWVGIGTRLTGGKLFEKATVHVEGAGRPFDKVAKWSTETDEYHYQLSVADGDILIVGQPARLKLEVTKPGGEPVELKSTMRLGSLAAFAADYTSAALMFPTDDSIQGGPAQDAPHLTFIFTPPSPGFWKLFSEVKAGGFPRVASFGVNASEARRCQECAAACQHCAERCRESAT